MTLENAQRLLKHFNDLADGTIPKPFGHKDWPDVVANAKVRAVEMEAVVERRSRLPKYAQLKVEEKPKVKAKEEKKDGKGSA